MGRPGYNVPVIFDVFMENILDYFFLNKFLPWLKKMCKANRTRERGAGGLHSYVVKVSWAVL